MINVLVATKVDGSWKKVAVLRATSKSYNVPAAIAGEVAGYVARAAVDYFRAESAAVEMEFLISSREYRATRFDGATVVERAIVAAGGQLARKGAK